MADDLVIRSSGAAAIDTNSLRSAAGESRGLAARLRCLQAPLELAGGFIASASTAAPGVRTAREVHEDLMRAARRIEELGEDCERLAGALDVSADRYELVEVHAAWELAGRDSAERTALEARASVLGTRLWGVSGPDAAFDMLVRTGAYSEGDHGDAFRAQAAWGAALIAGPGAAPLGFVVAGAVQLMASGFAAERRDADAGRAPARTPPDPRRDTSGSSAGVAVTPVRRAPAPPVAGFADAGRRISGPERSRVRVERYTMPGGGREWAVYITGTQSTALGGSEPFDMRSNLALYDGHDAASSAAVRAALADAGVEPGEPIHAFAHSQGAMAAETVVRQGYDVETLVTFGAPTTGPLPQDVTAITIRHTDDPIAALAGNLPAAERGAAGGFVAERVADPLPGLRDVGMPAHALSAYVDTGARLDASADPRARAIDPLWERLGRAESVRVTEYATERVSRAGAAAAG